MNRFRIVRLLPAVLLATFLSHPAAAQETEKAADVTAIAAQFKAVRSSTSPQIDGDLSDAAWATAPEITNFTQHNPDDGKPATVPTVVKVVYDDAAIYFSARMDDTHPVTSRLGRRDSTLESDYFRVQIDPYHDRQSGNSFSVYASNVQTDGALFNDTALDIDWDGIWTSATKIWERGWTAEMRIPYSQLRFPDRPTHIWGINFFRYVVRNNEEARLINTPKGQSGNVSRFADLNGIEGIRPKRLLEVVPYAVSSSQFDNTISDRDPFNSTQEFKGDLGVDVKYGLTSNLTLTGSVNPDFGQVEVDPARLNLSAFELFYPEKRPFFIEGSNLFTQFGRLGSSNFASFNFFTPEFFYSRRIGRSPQGTGRLDYDFVDAPNETSILGAIKLTGKTSGWSIGALDVLTNHERANFTLNSDQGSQIVEPMTNYFVSRVSKDLGKNAGIGALLTSVKRSLPDSLDYLREEATSGGVDGYRFWGKKDYVLQWFVGGSRVEGSPEAIAETQRSSARYFQRPDADGFRLDGSRTSLSGWAGRLKFAKRTGKWRYDLKADTYSPGFEVNDVGFMQRADITVSHAMLQYVNEDVTPRFRERVFFVGKYQNWNHDGDLIANGIYGDGYTTFNNYLYVFAHGGSNSERFDDRQTRGGPVTRTPSDVNGGIGFGTDSRKKLFFEIFQQNYRDALGSYDHSGGLLLKWKPTSNVSVSLNPFFARSFEFAQYVTAVNDGSAIANFGRRYVFAGIDQRLLEIGTRLDWTFTSDLSLQLYVQPFIATGDYSNFKELEAPRTMTYIPYSDKVFDPDFKIRSVRGSAVLRWQFIPGSAVFFVWNENREDFVPTGRFTARRDLAAIGDIPSDDIFLVKVSYLLPI